MVEEEDVAPPAPPSMLQLKIACFFLYHVLTTNVRIERVGGCASGGGKKSKLLHVLYLQFVIKTNIVIIDKKKKAKANGGGKYLSHLCFFSAKSALVLSSYCWIHVLILLAVLSDQGDWARARR